MSSLRIQYIGKENLKLKDELGEVDVPYDPVGKSSIGIEEKELLSEIIKKINEVFGMDFQEEDKFCLDKVINKMNQNQELEVVFKGNNSTEDKKEYFMNTFKDYIGDYYSDRMEFYKKVMDKKVFPMLIEGIFTEYMKHMSL